MILGVLKSTEKVLNFGYVITVGTLLLNNIANFDQRQSTQSHPVSQLSDL